MRKKSDHHDQGPTRDKRKSAKTNKLQRRPKCGTTAAVTIGIAVAALSVSGEEKISNEMIYEIQWE